MQPVWEFQQDQVNASLFNMQHAKQTDAIWYMETTSKQKHWQIQTVDG